MRLIDADKLIEKLRDFKEWENDDGRPIHTMSETQRIDRCINFAQTEPTAFDADKVVSELEKNASRYTKKYVTPYGNNGYRDTKAISIHKAIEIVKQGCASDDDVCEWKLDGDMTIDEAIEKYKEIANTDANCPAHCNISCDKCVQESKQIAEWLEELKTNRIALKKANGYLETNYRLGYSKAIDDLLGGMNQITYNCQDADELFEKICDLAERLKAGVRECTDL